MAKSNYTYVCSECGANYPRWEGRCRNCGGWGTLVEEESVAKRGKSSHAGVIASGKVPEPHAITELKTDNTPRQSTSLGELDRAVGGGFMPGSANLIAGDPGIGKSTLLLQAAYGFILAGHGNVLYVSGEESESQLKRRAERLGALHDDLLVLSDANILRIIRQIEKIRPALVLIDSIQMMVHPDVPSAAGSIAQLRDTTARLIVSCKQSGITLAMIGHVTKEGTVAGPRTIEHMVDAVFYIEGDPQRNLRILRADKNRFGAVDEVGLFEMTSNGMMEVSDPARVLLNERDATAPGTILTPTLEGARVLLVEIQALTQPSHSGNPARKVTGLDANRIAMILAVLDRRAGIRFHQEDVYASVVGGLKVKEPGSDMAVACAIVSAFRDNPLPDGFTAIGEIGLTGEIRHPRNMKLRLNEAARRGLNTALIPTGGESIERIDGMKLVRVKTIAQAMESVW